MAVQIFPERDELTASVDFITVLVVTGRHVNFWL